MLRRAKGARAAAQPANESHRDQIDRWRTLGCVEIRRCHRPAGRPVHSGRTNGRRYSVHAQSPRRVECCAELGREPS